MKIEKAFRVNAQWEMRRQRAECWGSYTVKGQKEKRLQRRDESGKKE